MQHDRGQIRDRQARAGQRNAGPTRDEAEAIALSATAWIIADPELRDRFLAMTGWQPEELRASLSNPAFLCGVLDWLLAHEPTLLRFCEQDPIPPERLANARAALATDRAAP